MCNEQGTFADASSGLQTRTALQQGAFDKAVAGENYAKGVPPHRQAKPRHVPSQRVFNHQRVRLGKCKQATSAMRPIAADSQWNRQIRGWIQVRLSLKQLVSSNGRLK